MTPRIRPGRWSGAWAEPNSRSSADGAGRVVITRVQREAAVTDRSTDTGPGGRVGVTLVVAGVALAVVLVLVSWASHERSEPGSGSFAQVEGAFVTAGLTVCTTSVAADPLAPGALASRTYVLGPAGTGCAGDAATVVVDRFETVSDRDAAAHRFEVLNRPRGSGAVWTLGDTTVSVRGSSGSAVQAALAPALYAAGAR
jgi:hypothetical protein